MYAHEPYTCRRGAMGHIIVGYRDMTKATNPTMLLRCTYPTRPALEYSDVNVFPDNLPPWERR